MESGAESDRSTSWATTTATLKQEMRPEFLQILQKMIDLGIFSVIIKYLANIQALFGNCVHAI